MFINVGLHGYGGEVVLGNVTKKAYEFWTSEDAEEHFSTYVWQPGWFVEENPDFKIPKFAELPEWYEIDNIMHESGAAWGGCRIYIREMDDNGYNANEIREIYEDSFSRPNLPSVDKPIFSDDRISINGGFADESFSVEL